MGSWGLSLNKLNTAPKQLPSPNETIGNRVYQVKVNNMDHQSWRVIKGWVHLVAQGVWRVMRAMKGDEGDEIEGRETQGMPGRHKGCQGDNRDTRETIGMLEDNLGHGSEVRGEGKEGRTLLLILVDLATYLYKLGKAKRKESQGIRRDVKECDRE